MFYDTSDEPEDLTRWMDHELIQMRPAKGLAKAAINEVLKLRAEIARLGGNREDKMAKDSTAAVE